MEESPNIAETLAKEMKQPMEIGSSNDVTRIAIPPNWKMETYDLEMYADKPRRTKARISLTDDDSFIGYVKRHGSLANSTIWCEADYNAGDVAFTAILNDHGETDNEPGWRDHTATFKPPYSEEWNRWFGKNSKPFPQVEFATFIEDNLRDIAGGEGFANGGQMLEMALEFEATQDYRFKSAVRLQNGGVQMTLVQDDDQQTLTRMEVFDRFKIGIPVFWNGEAYGMEARLRYRHRDSKVFFWYELVRPDKVLEDAAKSLIEKIKTETGSPFFFGKPF